MSKKKELEQLSQILLQIKDAKKMQNFLEDFLSPAEAKNILERLRIVEMLIEGLPQRQIRDELNVSISKVSRCSQMLQYGKKSYSSLFKL